MGRFYQTADPHYVQDTIYRPDLKYAMTSLLNEQKEYDQQKAIAEAFMDIQFNHLNSDEENENARVAKEYYMQQADEIARQMQADKGNYYKYMDRLKALKRELSSDFQSGAIAKMQQSYNQEAQWRKDNAELLKTNPALYNGLLREARKNWGGNSVSENGNIWQQENGLKSFDQQKIEENIQKFVADIKKNSIQTTDGRYIYTDGTEQKYLTEEDILNYAYNKVASDPAAMAYFAQSDRLGLSNYLTNGKINMNGTLGNWFNALRSYAYNQTDLEHKMQENKYGLIAAEEAKEKRVAKFKKDLEKTDNGEVWLSEESRQVDDSPQQQQQYINSLRDQKKVYDQLVKEGKDPSQYAFTPEQQSYYNRYLQRTGEAAWANIDTKVTDSDTGLQKSVYNGDTLKSLGIDSGKWRAIKYKEDRGENLTVEERQEKNRITNILADKMSSDPDSLFVGRVNRSDYRASKSWGEHALDIGTTTGLTAGSLGIAGGIMGSIIPGAGNAAGATIGAIAGAVGGLGKGIYDTYVSETQGAKGSDFASKLQNDVAYNMSKDNQSEKYNVTYGLMNVDVADEKNKNWVKQIDANLMNAITLDNKKVLKQGTRDIPFKATDSGMFGKDREVNSTGFFGMWNDPNYTTAAQALRLIAEKRPDLGPVSITNPKIFKSVQYIYGTHGGTYKVQLQDGLVNDEYDNGAFTLNTGLKNDYVDKRILDNVVKTYQMTPDSAKGYYISNNPISKGLKAELVSDVERSYRSGTNLEKEIPQLGNGIYMKTKNHDNHIEVGFFYKNRLGEFEPINGINKANKSNTYGINMSDGSASESLDDLSYILTKSFIFRDLD